MSPKPTAIKFPTQVSLASKTFPSLWDRFFVMVPRYVSTGMPFLLYVSESGKQRIWTFILRIVERSSSQKTPILPFVKRTSPSVFPGGCTKPLSTKVLRKLAEAGARKFDHAQLKGTSINTAWMRGVPHTLHCLFSRGFSIVQAAQLYTPSGA